MNIPRYWSKAEATETDRKGKQVQFKCWRGSSRSPEEARELAANDARRILSSLLRGEKLQRYAYSDAPLREEILQEFHDGSGKTMAMVTRNLSGAMVLNTDRIMFVDVDFPPPSPGAFFKALFQLLFRSSRPSPQEEQQANALRRVEDFLAARPEFGFRAYRTCAGMRLLATHDLFDPADPATLLLLESLGSDPLYVKLCRTQQSFRARLTPKPYRCGVSENKIRHPREDSRQEEAFQRWKSGYEQSSQRYATCRYQGAMGNEIFHPEVEQIITLHDELTRAHENLELA
jgi:hypothetical protein